MTTMTQQEEITDLFDIRDMHKLKRGQVLKFQQATIRITKIDRHHQRIWGKHITLVDPKDGWSHLGHHLDQTIVAYERYGTPFCQDCQVPVSDHATQAGDDLNNQRTLDQHQPGTKH